ncbi:hypothetical protein MZK47_14160 [Microbacterium aerolatum]|uniref:hypothetical protein n=1 Tax=Microbacterium aerolatum TaxID=153731 RepID=UPI002000C9F9|nr:hypothetical protein [Microbacterium aerolatum]MCK3770821.1 hypothetical protein [Microbacterium aerolatum]
MVTPTPPDAAAAASLARIIRAIFPHDRLGDGPYLRAAETILGNVAGSAHQHGVVAEGVRSLEAIVGGDLSAVPVDELTRILQSIRQTEFFQILLTSSVVSLYSDPETWELLGYEGASFDKGGYLHRGFDDLDWLPEPRITEYEGDPLVEYNPPVPGLQVSFSDTKKVATV